MVRDMPGRRTLERDESRLTDVRVESRITIHYSRLVLCAAALLAAAPASAQQYPVKPIRFIIAQAPGGQNDVQARIIGAKLSVALGQPIVYDNRAGAGGQITFELMAQTPPPTATPGWESIASPLNNTPSCRAR